MKLENSFTVAAPLEDTWRALLDIKRVATCLPGATIEPDVENGVYRGAMKVKLGPMTVDYRGTARLQDVDEDAHVASIAVQAREVEGGGTAAAVIRNRVQPENGATRVIAETDLRVTGRQAQFGRGILEDVAAEVMARFAEGLEQELQGGRAAEEAKPPGGGSRQPGVEAGADTISPPPPEAERKESSLDLGGLLTSSAVLRYWGAGLMLIALLLLLALAGNRRRFTLNINLRR